MKRYCYALHHHAVSANLQASGILLDDSGAVEPVHGPNQLRGLSGGVFLSVENHPKQIPESILHAAESAGMIWVGISDEWMRDRLGHAR